MTSNLSNKSSKILMGSIFILIIICSTLGFVVFNIESKLNSIQSNYNHLVMDNNNLKNSLSNLQSSLNQLNDDVITSSSQERISIARVASVNESTLTVFVKSLSGVDIVIVDANLRDSFGNTIGNIIAQNNRQMHPEIIPSSGSMVHFDISFPNEPLTIGYAYTITLISQKDNSFTSAPFTRTNVPDITPSPQPFTP